MNADDTVHIVLPFVDMHSIEAAFPVARAMAKALHAPLHVAAPAEQAGAAQDLAQRLPPGERDAVAIESDAAGLLAAIKRRADCSRHAMVILAARYCEQTSDAARQTSGAIARQVMESVARPILIVPPDRDMRAWRLHKALMPQDGTPGCAGALAQFINRSSPLGIENLVLRIAGAKVDQPTEPGSLATPRYVDHPQYEWDDWAREFLDRIVGMGARLDGSKLTLLMATGEPAAETLRVSRERNVDMIVLPWHGAIASGRARMVKTILQGATCPVLLLPERSGRRGEMGEETKAG